MKLITWNVNGLRAVERKGEIQTLIEIHEPDVLLLQEIKGKKEQFSKYLTENPEYQQFYHSAQKPGYAGTGIWVKNTFASQVRRLRFNMHAPQTQSSRSSDEYESYRDEGIITPYASSIYDQDSHNDFMVDSDEGRVSHLSFLRNGKMYDIASIYFPNGGKSDQAWREKLVFYTTVLKTMNALRSQGHEVIIGGDMNVAHNDIDLARPKENDGKIGFHPKERAWMDAVMDAGWVDVWRAKNPEVKDVYSWWDMKTKARDRNVGWRIDYFFIDKDYLQEVTKIEYLHEQFGSDHCPLLMELI
jgi:exodeoxyribonuclease-3